MALAAEEAAQADDILDRTLAAACLAVTLDRVTLDAALVGHFAYLREEFPAVYSLVVARLRETQGDWLVYTPGGQTHD